MAAEKSLEKSGHQDEVDEVRKQSIVESFNMLRNVMPITFVSTFKW